MIDIANDRKWKEHLAAELAANPNHPAHGKEIVYSNGLCKCNRCLQCAQLVKARMDHIRGNDRRSSHRSAYPARNENVGDAISQLSQAGFTKQKIVRAKAINDPTPYVAAPFDPEKARLRAVGSI